MHSCFCYVFLTRFQICDIIAVTHPFQKDLSFSPQFMLTFKVSRKNDF